MSATAGQPITKETFTPVHLNFGEENINQFLPCMQSQDACRSNHSPIDACNEPEAYLQQRKEEVANICAGHGQYMHLEGSGCDAGNSRSNATAQRQIPPVGRGQRRCYAQQRRCSACHSQRSPPPCMRMQSWWHSLQAAVKRLPWESSSRLSPVLECRKSRLAIIPGREHQRDERSRDAVAACSPNSSANQLKIHAPPRAPKKKAAFTTCSFQALSQIRSHSVTTDCPLHDVTHVKTPRPSSFAISMHPHCSC